MKLADHLSWLSHGATTALVLTGMLIGCANSPTPTIDGRVYHCVGTDHPIPPQDTWAKKTPLELFEYGDYVDANRPTISGSSYCGVLAVPKLAYLRYQVDGRVIEKRFDLSTLNVQRVRGKTIEFFVDGNVVEVRLLTPVPGRYVDTKEVIDRR
ncbi:MAG: hypothetical protein V4864_06460 [Pseudomonadota bacterium]